MSKSYQGVTSIQVLDRLARAADLPSPLDVLRLDKFLIDIPDSCVEKQNTLPPDMIEQMRIGFRRKVSDLLYNEIAQDIISVFKNDKTPDR